eukprot:scaffold1087_cov198-Pinguiococcus_pyrenoidosus.AAC.30
MDAHHLAESDVRVVVQLGPLRVVNRHRILPCLDGDNWRALSRNGEKACILRAIHPHPAHRALALRPRPVGGPRALCARGAGGAGAACPSVPTRQSAHSLPTLCARALLGDLLQPALFAPAERQLRLDVVLVHFGTGRRFGALGAPTGQHEDVVAGGVGQVILRGVVIRHLVGSSPSAAGSRCLHPLSPSLVILGST